MKTKITHATYIERNGTRHPGIAIHGPTHQSPKNFIGTPSWEKARRLGEVIEHLSTFEHGAQWCPEDLPVELHEA